jgi:predicted nucleotide-binding protein (sugar kinase/HSP70/actin superfamily)
LKNRLKKLLATLGNLLFEQVLVVGILSSLINRYLGFIYQTPMNKEQLKPEFLPKEIALQLHGEMEASDYKSRIKLVNEYAESIRHSFDNEVFEVKLNNELGFLYWQGNQFHSAIKHYEKVVNILQAKHYPWVYFQTIGMLCRCNRLIKEYQKSYHWIMLAFEQSDLFNSSFDGLLLLTEYKDLLSDSEMAFDGSYMKIITTIIEDLDFPEISLTNPILAIQKLQKMNLKWNRELSRITLMPRENKEAILDEFEKYEKACEIGWYRSYAKESINQLKR